mmetsp:Transcript_53615/g.162852  ORF Transcript_53615/g.162852 Transcript_53615/m.162852 type:complete len:215 (-) Transcript_53615:410-1054(-)
MCPRRVTSDCHRADRAISMNICASLGCGERLAMARPLVPRTPRPPPTLAPGRRAMLYRPAMPALSQAGAMDGLPRAKTARPSMQKRCSTSSSPMVSTRAGDTTLPLSQPGPTQVVMRCNAALTALSLARVTSPLGETMLPPPSPAMTSRANAVRLSDSVPGQTKPSKSKRSLPRPWCSSSWRRLASRANASTASQVQPSGPGSVRLYSSSKSWR